MPLPAIPFYMIRHGESTANLGEFASGHVDVPLTDKGLAQARAAREIVKTLEIKPSIIIHSHLQRARNTAAILNEVLALDMIEDPEIAEQHYGDWEGQPWSLTRQPTRDGVNPPNGETHADFYERIRGCVTRHVNERQPGPVMFVCHGGVFRAIGGLYDHKIFGIENCSLHYFEPKMTQDEPVIFPWEMRIFKAG